MPVERGCALSAPEEAAGFGSNDIPYRDGVLAWPTGDAAAEGLDPESLAQIADDVGLSSTASSFLVVRNGALVAERYYHSGRADMAYNIHSVSKSLLSLIVGAAIADGAIPSVDTPIADLLPPDLAAEPGADGLTVRHLLTMSGGVKGDSVATIDAISGPSHPSQARAILQLPRISEPGAEFSYYTGLTHLLAVVTANAVGSPLCEYAQKRLFGPMGITVDHWHSDLQGYFTGGTSMFITPREMARVGQFVLQRGKWGGRQIVPASWIDEMTTQVWNLDTATVDKPWGYGYLWWLDHDVGGYEVWNVWGYAGQEIFVVPAVKLVVVKTQRGRERVAPFRASDR
ncbi:MAG: beta-lactamase family protein [Chloroflexota bacterium]|nr:beta-lactamase family protein [Chloroflexota bacterium]